MYIFIDFIHLFITKYSLGLDFHFNRFFFKKEAMLVYDKIPR